MVVVLRGFLLYMASQLQDIGLSGKETPLKAYVNGLNFSSLRCQLHAASGSPYTILYLPSISCFLLLNSSWRQHAFTSAFCSSLTCSSIIASLKDFKAGQGKAHKCMACVYNSVVVLPPWL